MCKEMVKNVKRCGFYMIPEINITTEKKRKYFFFNAYNIANKNTYTKS